MDQPSVKSNLIHVKKIMAREIFNERKYNPEVLAHALEKLTQKKKHLTDSEDYGKEEGWGIWWQLGFFMGLVLLVMLVRYAYLLSSL